ncbi:MAG: hypothetical protein U0169_17065 [Polyangiaceae bacterium]
MDRRAHTLGSTVFALVVGCGGAVERAADGGTGADDESGAVIADQPSASTSRAPSYELKPHSGIVIPAMRLHVVWIGESARSAAGPVASEFARWYLASEPWKVLAQYGVGPGSVVSEETVDAREILGAVTELPATVPLLDFEKSLGPVIARVRERTAPEIPEGSNARESWTGLEDAFVFVLPDDVNIGLGTRGTYTYRTCVDALGYHGFDGRTPYVVLPPCVEGRSTFVLSHEIAEMASDPIVGKGWFDPENATKSAGEAADLCKAEGPVTVSGWPISRLWSNRDSRCLPR